jgi:uncharacterized membrane protein YcaP (DUF421 family)
MHSIWNNMFILGLPILEKVLRPLIVYVFLVVGLRLAGKRELAQLNPFDLVVLLTISNTVQNAIIGEDNSVTGGLLGAAALLLINYIVVRFLFAHPKLDRIVEGDPDVLIEGGIIKEDRMKSEVVTRAELEAAAHKQGLAGLEEIERAVIEPGGNISFVQKKPTSATIAQSELSTRLDAIIGQLAEIRLKLGIPETR